MAKSATKTTKKPVKKVAGDNAIVQGFPDSKSVNAAASELKQLILAFAKERGLKVTRRGTALYSKGKGRLVLPTYILIEPVALAEKGDLVISKDEREGEVTKIEGNVAFVKFEDTGKVTRMARNKLTIVQRALDAKRASIGATLATGVKVEVGKIYATKNGGKARLVSERDGRAMVWKIQHMREGTTTWYKFGQYGTARSGKEGDSNRRFAETQLRKLTGGFKGIKKSLPET